MTIKEAIKTIKEFIGILEISDFPVYDNEREALEKIMHDAENWNEMINNIPHCIDDKSHSCEEIGEGLHKIAKIKIKE